MKNIAALIALLALASPALAADEYAIDPGHSSVGFRIKHLNISYTKGRFNKPAGSLTFDEKNPKACKVEVTLKIAELDTHDAKRDAHLRGPDFFNGKMFPKITFKSTGVKKTGEKEYAITGDLSLHGVTKSVTVKAVKTGEGADPWGGHRIGFELKLTIKRSDYKMNFMQGGVGDEVKLAIDIEGIRK
jgi:polyisoprenoid-binding protein YceI